MLKRSGDPEVAARLAEKIAESGVKLRLNRLVVRRLRVPKFKPVWTLVAPDGLWTGFFDKYIPHGDRFAYATLPSGHILSAMNLEKKGSFGTTDPFVGFIVSQTVPKDPAEVLRGTLVSSLSEVGLAITSS